MRFGFFSVFIVLPCLEVFARGITRRDAMEHLISRQTTIGQQCNAQCAPFESNLQTCSPSTCLCTSSTAASLQVCIDCAVTVTSGATDLAQGLINNYKNACAGTNVPAVTIPNQSSSTSARSASAGGGKTSIGSSGSNSGAPSTSSTAAPPPQTTFNSGNLPSLTPTPTFSQVTIGPSGTSTSPSDSSAQTSSPVSPQTNQPGGATIVKPGAIMAAFSAFLGVLAAL
ncbi:hypothetical protein CPC08DRAFT_708911 [Agrocybe pediades]|nr:hypothetical protein CPC08DRAFT_708911 [Agrocybe pediades]